MGAEINHSSIVRALPVAGLVSSVLYVVIDVIGATSYPGYDYSAQAISEMSAIGAPTVDLLAPLYGIWSLLFLAFTAGVWIFGRGRPPYGGPLASCLQLRS